MAYQDKYSVQADRPDDSMIRMRLDMTKLLNKIRVYLTGKKVDAFEDENGDLQKQEIVISKPLVNDDGSGAVMNRIEMVLNVAVVQGNFDRGMWRDAVADLRESLAAVMMDNLDLWGISEDDYQNIIDGVMDAVKPFMTRLIENKERESYQGTLQAFQRMAVGNDPNRGFFGSR